jgi:hypothetical protein
MPGPAGMPSDLISSCRAVKLLTPLGVLRHGEPGYSRPMSRTAQADASSTGPRRVAQAAELNRALRAQLRDMSERLASVERRGLQHGSTLTPALRREAAALRRDIRQAQALIDRLQRSYGDERPRRTPPRYPPHPSPPLPGR